MALRCRNRYLTVGLAILVLLGLSSVARAHNGAVAVAVPVVGIKIDGDVSDWPPEAQEYAVAKLITGEPPRDARDCRATFRIGYNTAESALYVAVEMQDESTVLAGGYGWERDGCELYLDLDHGEDSSSVFQPVVWGQERKVFRNGTDEISKPVDRAVRRAEGSTWYEWRVDLASLYEKPVTLDPGTVLGFDVIVYDRDGDGTYTVLAWGSGSAKYMPGDARSRGDAVLVATGATGRIAGQVRWEGQEAGRGSGIARIRLLSLARPGMWVQLRTDRQGGFEAELPAGRYGLQVVEDRQKKPVEIEVRSGGKEDLGSLVVAPRPIGRTVKAGKGRTVKAGMGVRRGLWQHFDVEDGLPSNVILEVFQDWEGFLWFGTRGGLCRYDGTSFTTFTVEDGLPDNRIYAIRQDHQGNLWLGSFDHWTVGTGGGVTRYDGEYFTSFNTGDGLADNWVTSIAEDREGNLWFGNWQGGISRYDGMTITTYTTEDGLPNPTVWAMLEDPEGQLWFRTESGTCRYDGQRFVPFVAPAESAKHPLGQPMLWDHQGNLWLGQGAFSSVSSAPPLGVSRYDGRSIATLLSGYRVSHVLEDRDGNLWFADWPGGGLTRYDGRESTRVASEGLSTNAPIEAMIQDREGHLWVGTWGGGVSRYDGYQLGTLSADSILSHSVVNTITQDTEGNLWLGSGGGGLCRYDGRQFHRFTTQDGLPFDNVRAVCADERGGCG